MLSKKVDQCDFISLNNTVSNLVNSINRIGDIVGIKSSLETKANDSEVKTLRNKLDRIDTLINTIVAKIPSELITQQLDTLASEISNISGRLSVLERKINTSNNAI